MASPDIVYSAHALRRMRDRGIRREVVEAVVAKPEVTMPSKDGPSRRKLLRTVGGRRLVVVIGVGPTHTNTVISAWCREEED
jgi:hypothetical protein